MNYADKFEGKSDIYLTTTLPYVNAKPHVGHALELVQADFLARTLRQMGYGVFFNTGTDEHGQKIAQKSKQESMSEQDFVDKYSREFEELFSQFDISNDAFIRTTDKKHIQAVQQLWRRCDESGDIYKKEFTGLYCVGCELFLTEKELTDEGLCPDHNRKPEVVTAENYFFKFSRYTQPLLDYLSHEETVIPDHHRQWAINFVKSGLEDFPISREIKRLSWGVPVPGDDEHVMYVWFDALTNYISTLGWPEAKLHKTFWNDGYTIQVAGKDQVRMQSLMWQSMLMSAGLQPTNQIFYHGFINSGGKKMSKSLGNVIDPFDLINEYSTDALRYYLLRHISPSADSDLTPEKFKDAYNANLVNGIGNLVSRVLTMANSYEVEYATQDRDDILASEEADKYFDLVVNYKFNEALDWLWSEFSALDNFITEREPYKVIKTNEEKARADVAYCCIRLHELSQFLLPVIPRTAEAIIDAFESRERPENLFPRK